MKKILFVGAALAGLVFAFSANAQTLQDVSAKYDAAVAKGQAKDLAAAIPLFEEVVTMGQAVGETAAATVKLAQDALPQLYLGHAAGLANAQKFEESLTYLNKAAASDNAQIAGRAKGMMAQINNALAGAAWNANDFAKAAELFAKAHELQPANPKITTQLAESYGKLKEYDKSYELFRGLIAANNDAELKKRLAFYMLLNANEVRATDAAKAVEILVEAVELDNNPQAWMLLLQTADNAKAIEYGQRATEAQTDATQKSNAYSLLGAAYEKAGDKTKAIEAYRKVTAGPNAAAAKAQVTALQAQ